MNYATKYTDVDLPIPPMINGQKVEMSNLLQNETKFGGSNLGCDNFITILDPYEYCYLDSTTKIDISSIGEGATVSYITDGVQTLTFSQDMMRLQVPNSWGEWAGPPYTESSTPSILFSNYASQVNINLSKPSEVFGFELELNSVGISADVSVDFYSGTTLLGTISKTIINYWGNPGARLFAAAYSCIPFDNVNITINDPNYNGFAIAQIRYGDGIDCDQYCTNKDIPFECTIDTGFNVLGIGQPAFLGYNIDVICDISKCYSQPKIKICDNYLECDLPCVPVDRLCIKGQAKLLLTISTMLDVKYPGPQITNFSCISDIDICQACFKCFGKGICDSGTLVLKNIKANISGDHEVTITGEMTFICPE